DRLGAHTVLDEGARGLELGRFLEGAHAHLVAAVGAAEEDHRPAVRLRVAEAGDRVRHAGTGDGKRDAGAARQITDSAAGVRGGLLVAHADEGQALALPGGGDRLHREADDAKHVLDAVHLERARDYGGAVDVCQLVPPYMRRGGVANVAPALPARGSLVV